MLICSIDWTQYTKMILLILFYSSVFKDNWFQYSNKIAMFAYKAFSFL